ncbi:MAG TPA: hypothetical protein VMF51_17920 [Nocardioides sp.]|nr:hypothetical protein [Nocardioides sp.]HTW17013.1 hypothetical protein [Nocardioides sp.]
MKLSNRALAFWAIAVFIVIGLVLILIGVLEGDDTDNVNQQPADSLASVR